MSKELTKQHMAQTRRSFIGQGAFAFLAAAGIGHRAFGATGAARLRFGALSDIHIAAGKDSCNIFEKALMYFRDQKVDAVLIAGDMAESGLDSQLRLVGDTWYRVFPGDKRPDGEHVEKIFVTGNHDVDGWFYEAARKLGVTKEKHGDNILALHMAEGWKRAFDEDYAPMYVKTVKGYKFVGVHYDPDGGYHKKGAIAAFLESHRDELLGAKPFFYTQHFHPRGTCSAPWTWGQDAGYSTDALSAFPNAVAFSGHSHTPLSDDRTLWRGTFTSVGAASLRNLIPFGGRENSAIFGEKGVGNQQMAKLTGRDAQQGLLVTVYDERIVLERRDFANDLSAGPDWIVPLPAHASSFAERAKSSPVPEFPTDAEVTIERRKGKNRAKKKVEQFVVSFPNVRGLDGGARAFDYQVTVEAEDVDRPKIWATKYVYSPHFYWAAEKDDEIVSCVFASSELPQPNNKVSMVRGRRFRFAVAPANSFGVHGKAIRSDWLTGNFGTQ